MSEKTSSTGKLYQIKVVLQDSKPPIWRRLLISPEITLFDLHKIIQISIGWTNSHLHQFKIDNKYYSIPSEDDWQPVIDERKIHIAEIAPVEGSKFVYEYDFGDSWGHDVIVEKILPVEPKSQYPKCIKGKCACPPEDVGGVSGYEEFLEVIADPSHPEHEEWITWAGGDFDPTRFNPKATTKDMQGGLPDWRQLEPQYC